MNKLWKWSIVFFAVSVLFTCLVCVAYVASGQYAYDTQQESIPIPTPTLTKQQKLGQIITDNSWGGSVTTTSGSGTIIVNNDMVGGLATTHIGKSAIFDTEKAIWKSSLHPEKVIVNILAPVQDKYGNKLPDETLLSATLEKATAAKFNWDNLDADSSWGDYDKTYTSQILDNSN